MFPVKNRSYNLVKVILLLFFFGFIVIAFIPNLLTKNIIVHSWGKEAVLGWSGYLLFTLFFISTFVAGLIILWKKFFANSGIVKKQLLFIALSVSIAGFFGVLFNLFLLLPFYKVLSIREYARGTPALVNLNLWIFERVADYVFNNIRVAHEFLKPSKPKNTKK